MKYFKESEKEKILEALEIEREKLRAKPTFAEIFTGIVIVGFVCYIFWNIAGYAYSYYIDVKKYEEIPWELLEEKSYDILEIEYNKSYYTYTIKYVDEGKLKIVCLDEDKDKIEEELVYIGNSNKIYIEKYQKTSDLKGREEKEEITKLELTEATYKRYF